MALITRRCRDLVRGSVVEFVVDTVLREVVEIGVITTSRPITVFLTGPGGTSSRTQQPNLTRRYDVSVELVAVIDDTRNGSVRPAWPFVVQF